MISVLYTKRKNNVFLKEPVTFFTNVMPFTAK